MRVRVERWLTVDRPPYVIPTMEQIRAVRPNGRVVVSTFAGCGGSSLGYRLAGFRVAWANEFIQAARDVYERNADPQTIVDGRDIRVVRASEILSATGLDVGELDVLDGSPPCASFSVAGSRERGWGKIRVYSETKQRVDDLFGEFVRLLAGLRPRAFVAENVAGLVVGKAKGYFLEILRAMRGAGYRVACRVVDAQWCGVPQKRARTIFIGIRSDLGVDPRHPAPLPYRFSLHDAIGGLDAPVEPEATLGEYDVGKRYRRLALGESDAERFSLIRADPRRPCPCIQASHGKRSIACVTHPTECRKFSIAELRRICSFPPDFVLSGTFQQQWERLGRAVPPLMMARIATVLSETLDQCKTV